MAGGTEPGSKRRLHLTLALGLALSTLGLTVELRRALHGHLLAWAYVVEWPVLGVFGTYVWWNLTHPEAAERRKASRAARKISSEPSIPEDDPDLLRWQAHLAQRNSHETRPEAEPESRS